MKRTIGILTYHDSDNFGSVLQAYALSQYLKNLGNDVSVIDFRKREVAQLYRILQPMNSIYNALTNLYKLLYLPALKKRKQAFEDFREKHLPLTDTRYDESALIPKREYNCYITGSDQVWNVGIVDFDPIYMLRGIEGRKLSYAASFGPKPLETEKYMAFHSDLSSIDAVSVREQSSVNLCRDIGVPAQWVCDPIFLLDRKCYSELELKCPLPEKYVLCYFPGGVVPEMELFSRQLARDLGAKRILLSPEWRNIFRAGKKQYCTGPGEFLYLFQHAQCICTTSFHGTAFSVIMEKKCYCYSKGTDERITSLLSLLQGVVNVSDCVSRISPEVNKSKLTELIDRSKMYLCENIG